MLEKLLPRTWRKIYAGLIMATVFLLMPHLAFAMHISEGILPFSWAAFWTVVVTPFVLIGLNQIKKQSKDNPSFKPLVGLMAAVIVITVALIHLKRSRGKTASEATSAETISRSSSSSSQVMERV